MRKVINFITNNRIITLVISVVVLSLILLAIPGFAKFGLKGSNEYVYHSNGYTLFFGGVKSIVPTADNVGGVVGQGVAAFILLIIGGVAAGFSKKSSFVMLLTSLELIATAIVFFTMKGAVEKAYSAFALVEKDLVIGFINYFIGAIVLIAGLLLAYKTVMVMKDEIKHPVKKHEGPSYNYLKK